MDLTQAHRPIVKGLTLPEGMTPLDEHYLNQFLNGDLFGYLAPDLRLDRVELSDNEDYGGLYVWYSEFHTIGNWPGDRCLQIMTKLHLYSEEGETVEDNDPYSIPAQPIIYREVDLPGGVYRTSMNDPASYSDLPSKWRDVDLHIDWVKEEI